jgi:hypothetical protein
MGFTEAVTAFAVAYANQTTADWELLCSKHKRGNAKKAPAAKKVSAATKAPVTKKAPAAKKAAAAKS